MAHFGRREREKLKVVMMKREKGIKRSGKVIRLYALVYSPSLDENTWRLCH